MSCITCKISKFLGYAITLHSFDAIVKRGSEKRRYRQEEGFATLILFFPCKSLGWY